MRVSRLLIYLMFMVCGMGLFFGGIQMYIDDSNQVSITDEEVIKRAHELGMVDLKEDLFDLNEEDD